MLNNTLVSQIQQASVAERLHWMELILQSLKPDIAPKLTVKPFSPKRFTVRTFSLGQEVSVERDQLYLERGL